MVPYSALFVIDKAARTQIVAKMYLNAGNVTRRFFPLNSGLNNGKLSPKKNSEQINPVREINKKMSVFLKIYLSLRTVMTLQVCSSLESNSISK